MEADAPLVRLSGVRLGYAGDPVLDGVDLCIGAREFWFMVGANGSGKTTVLRAILGLLAPMAGEVWRHPHHASLGRIGFVPQRCEISRALPTTVREFVSLGAIGSHRGRESRESDLVWALERAGLAGLAERDYWSLSGGQRQRALVARALVRRPRLLVLDEPTEGMDAASERAFLGTLTQLHALGDTTLLCVTHRLDQARHCATHVAFVGNGGLRSGPRSDLESVLDPSMWLEGSVP